MRDGASIDIGGVRAETLLALLALRAGSPVSADVIIDELWAGEPPDGAATTLRSYVSRLRAALGDQTPIERQSGGYVLVVTHASVDVARFEVAVREGRELLGRGRSRRAADVLRAAVALWRGQPFAGLPADGALRAEAVRLEELRLLALESRFEADLDAGRAADVVNEIEGLIAEHPFRERLWRHLMLALYREGRQADALAAYHRARAALDEQLGIEPGDDLRELEAAILRQDVPAPSTSRPDATALPVALTSFVGREQELEAVRAALGRARLVTLTGVGGAGKTRLALELARRADDIADGVGFVDLAALSDSALLEAHVAASIGVVDASGSGLPSAVAELVGTTDFLLVLDNCEHMRAAAARVAQRLLASSQGLRILATSREVLDVAGELPYPVPPLGLPGPDDAPDDLRASEAVRLLVDRATLTRHDLDVDDAAYVTAARICRELDGLPLAIELAAARTKALSLEEIAARLRDRFQFLVSWRRLSAARHRTLREAMDWSYELLAADEQRLLARLSVFPAGATLDSIAAVCLDGDHDEAERLVERLVDASLLVPIDGDLGTRYRLLETVRQYASERLDPVELARLQRLHAERMRVIARSTNLGLEGASHAGRLDVARQELPSIRAAIQWAESTDPTLAIEIASALERFWAFTHAQEGIAIFSALLAHDSLSDEERARAMRCRGGSRYASGDYAGGVADYEAALAIHQRLEQRAHQAHLLMRLAIEAQRVGDLAAAERMSGQAASIGGEERFAPDRYVGLELEADFAFGRGDDQAGFALLELALERATEAGDVVWQLDSLELTAERAMERGLLDEAARAARGALALAREIEVRQGFIWGLAILAQHAAATGSHRRAGRLWGGLEVEVERAGPVGQWETDEAAVRARVRAIAGDGFDAGLAEGRGLSLDAVVAEALDLS